MNQQAGHSNIKWGAIIAGAAIATGAVLFYPPIAEVIPKMFAGIGEWITSLFTTATAAAPVVEKTAQQIAEEAAKSEAARQAAWALTRKVGGAVLAGGGLAYFMGAKKEEPQAHPDSESFAMKEQMRAANAMMVMRAAYAGNPQAQAMLAQQQR